MRYLSQRYTMPTGRGKAVLTDIGTEELAHWEMIATMIFKLTQSATIAQIGAAGYGGHYAIWDSGIFPSDSNGVPFTTDGLPALMPRFFEAWNKSGYATVLTGSKLQCGH